MTTYKKLAAIEANHALFPKTATPLILSSLVNSGRLTSAAANAGVTNTRKQIIIGEDFETHLPVTLTDKEREGGVYILGEPRKGKSTLMVSMAVQDINNGHGLLFIDPHYDAINDLLSRIPKSRLDDVILLDPSDKNRSFALNVLHCPDPDDAIELDIAAGRVRDIFTKLWADERGELGIWLNKIITNAVHILLANPNQRYTLADLPLLLTDDPTLRNSLLKHVKKSTVLQFWHHFDSLSKRDRMEQAGPAISRLDILLADSRVRDIVGQSRSTIDFADILRTGKIVLLRRASNIDQSIKNLIGTIVLSEFVYAMYERAELPEEMRTYFGIYCDEFQEFATPDFARLFTQTGKLGGMPVVAHQTRQQFRPQDPNYGATAASPTKIFFTLSPIDASEMPLVFAKEPPTEAKREQELVICEDPLSDLLRRPHRNPDIRKFVNKYFRFLKDKRDDMKADMEGAKFARMVELDTAGFYGAEAQEEGIAGPTHYAGQAAAVEAKQTAILRARMHGINLAALHQQADRLRVTMRGLDRFLAEIMQGEKRRGQESFADFLIDLASGYSALAEPFAEALGLYIKLFYGDPKTARAIPFAFAQKYTLFQAVRARVQKQAEITRKKEEDVRRERYIARWEEDSTLRESIRRGRARDLWPRLKNYKLRFGTGWLNLEGDLLKPFLLMCARPSVQKMLAPYLTTRFAGAWKEAYKKWNASIPKDVLERLEYVRIDDGRDHYDAPYSSRNKVHFAPPLLDSFKAFFEKYKEGGVVALTLMNIAVYPKWCTWDIEGMIGDEGYYPDFNVLYLPVIENRKPWEVLRVLEQLTHALSDLKCETECAKFYERLAGTNPYQCKEREMRDGREIETDLDNLVKFGAQAGAFTRWIEERAALKEIKDAVGLNVWRKRLDIAQNKWWDGSPGLIKDYLIARACDIVRFGQEVADVTFPQPDVNGATPKEISEFVASLVEMVRYKEKYREWPNYVPELVVPEYLDRRVLSGEEARAVREACVKELRASDVQTLKVVGTINEFVAFCVLLAKPENHIMVPSGQYVENQVRARAEIDMVNEAARLLSSIEQHAAYVSLERKEGGIGAWTGKVKMKKLGRVAPDALMRTFEAIKPGLERCTRPRKQIRQEIEDRQNAWRASAMSDRADQSLPAGKRPSVPSARDGKNPTAPPPTRTKDRLPRSR